MQATAGDEENHEEQRATGYRHISLKRESGKPKIAGTRINVEHIMAAHVYGGLSAEAIAQAYPPLTLGEIYMALAYYYDHKEAIDHQIEAGRRFAEEMQSRHNGNEAVYARLKALGRQP